MRLPEFALCLTGLFNFTFEEVSLVTFVVRKPSWEEGVKLTALSSWQLHGRLNFMCRQRGKRANASSGTMQQFGFIKPSLRVYIPGALTISRVKQSLSLTCNQELLLLVSLTFRVGGDCIENNSYIISRLK